MEMLSGSGQTMLESLVVEDTPVKSAHQNRKRISTRRILASTTSPQTEDAEREIVVEDTPERNASTEKGMFRSRGLIGRKLKCNLLDKSLVQNFSGSSGMPLLTKSQQTLPSAAEGKIFWSSETTPGLPTIVKESAEDTTGFNYSQGFADTSARLGRILPSTQTAVSSESISKGEETFVGSKALENLFQTTERVATIQFPLENDVIQQSAARQSETSETQKPFLNPSNINKTSASEKKIAVAAVSIPKHPCMDELKEELSCSVCLEICFEPSSTICGHSFCKSCLESSIQQCGSRCPKCRQPLRRGFNSSFKINTVIWNTIKLLFPDEVSRRQKSFSRIEKASKSMPYSTSLASQNGTRIDNAEDRNVRRRRESGFSIPFALQDQTESDEALAWRLQQEEYERAHEGPSRRTRNSARSNVSGTRSASPMGSISVTTAAANLRTLASDAARFRRRR